MGEYETKLHRDMLAEIESCRQLPLSEEEKAESCFRISSKYWDILLAKYKEQVFKYDKDEIDFFRNIKPKFTSYIHFFIRVYEGVVSAPTSYSQALEYWEAETERFKRFYNKNREFVNYYESGGHQYDEFYFLRRNNYKQAHSKSIIFGDAGFLTSHDYMVAAYIGHKMYQQYVCEKIKVLRSSKEQTDHPGK